MNYAEAVDYIFGHTNYEAVPRVPHTAEMYDLRRVINVLERLGNPHEKAKSLHITGTNGKGSTSAMLASVLNTAGYVTGFYSSPHLITMRERFTVNGQMITEEETAALTTMIKPEIEAENLEAKYGRLTVFEILTILSFMYFVSKNCRFQVMEVGMGGRFDATNVIKPEVCLLTPISLDHREVLGDTIEKIAAEKCGIIKPGCTVISHTQIPEAAVVIERTCAEKGVKLIKLNEDITCREIERSYRGQIFEIKGRLDSYRVQIPLLGSYQQQNAAACTAALEVLTEKGYKIERKAIIDGLAKVNFPGRMQIIGDSPKIVLDGGHNPAAARNLSQAFKEYFKQEKAILVFGCSSDKDAKSIISELAPVFNEVIVTKADNPRSMAPEKLADEFKKMAIEVKISQNIPQAIATAKQLAGKEDTICITGSLFVVGEALKYLTG